jgi:hypothetical protein
MSCDDPAKDRNWWPNRRVIVLCKAVYYIFAVYKDDGDDDDNDDDDSNAAKQLQVSWKSAHVRPHFSSGSEQNWIYVCTVT